MPFILQSKTRRTFSSFQTSECKVQQQVPNLSTVESPSVNQVLRALQKRKVLETKQRRIHYSVFSLQALLFTMITTNVLKE